MKKPPYIIAKTKNQTEIFYDNNFNTNLFGLFALKLLKFIRNNISIAFASQLSPNHQMIIFFK